MQIFLYIPYVIFFFCCRLIRLEMGVLTCPIWRKLLMVVVLNYQDGRFDSWSRSTMKRDRSNTGVDCHLMSLKRCSCLRRVNDCCFYIELFVSHLNSRVMKRSSCTLVHPGEPKYPMPGTFDILFCPGGPCCECRCCCRCSKQWWVIRPLWSFLSLYLKILYD